MKNKLELITLWRVFNLWCRRPAFFKKKIGPRFAEHFFLKLSTLIDENRELTIGVSEKQIRS